MYYKIKKIIKMNTVQSFPLQMLPIEDQLYVLGQMDSFSIQKVSELDVDCRLKEEAQKYDPAALSTLIVWDAIARKILAEGGPTQADLESSKRAIEKAKSFGDWIEKHKDDLADFAELDLSHKGLIALPPEIGKLCLTKLDLSYNRLESLPPELWDIETLRVLNFSHNQFRKLFHGLTKGLSRLKCLEEIDFSHNEIKSLNAHVWKHLNKSLIFDLSHNQLQELPRMNPCTHFKKLDLSHNQLRALPEENWLLCSINELDLSHNSLRALPQEILNYTYFPDVKISKNDFSQVKEVALKAVKGLDTHGPEIGYLTLIGTTLLSIIISPFDNIFLDVPIGVTAAFYIFALLDFFRNSAVTKI